MYSAVMLPQAWNFTHLVSGLQAQNASDICSACQFLD
jgi:hypothetical protein